MKGLSVILGLALIVAGCSKDDHADGGTSGGGGDALAMEFRLTANNAIARAKSNDINMFNLDYGRLQSVLDGCDIVTTDDKLILKGDEKDAINYPDTNKIYLNRPRYRSYSESLEQEVIALHEVMGLAKIDDDKFSKSSRLIGFDPIKHKIIMQKVDILFVVDDSGSMQPHQQDVIQNVDYLLGELELKKADYHVGVITTSADMCNQIVYPNGYKTPVELCGPRLHSKGREYFITPFSNDPLTQISTNLLVGENGSSNEQAYDSIVGALSFPYVNGDNKGFYRPDARLEIIIISDTYEQSFNLSTANFLLFLSDLKNGDLSQVNMSVFLPMPGDPTCSAETPMDYQRYYDILTPLHGGMFNLCQSKLPNELKNLGQQLSDRLGN